jgi:ferritin-like protein
MSAYSEPVAELQPIDRDLHRALNTLKEEVEAVDWYHQRVATATDPELKKLVEHNRDEEIEHACMAIEWLRRTMPAWDRELRQYLFTTASITELEERAEAGEAEANQSQGTSDLGIGSLKV